MTHEIIKYQTIALSYLSIIHKILSVENINIPDELKQEIITELSIRATELNSNNNESI